MKRKPIPFKRGNITIYEQSIAAGDHFPEATIELFGTQSRRMFWHRSRARVLTGLISRFTNQKETEFLEVGCGTGNNLMDFRTLPNLRLNGADISLKMLQYASQRMPNIPFFQFDITRLPFKNRYGAIGAFDVLEHLDDDKTGLRRIHRALNSEGLLFLSVPQYQSLFSPLDVRFFHRRRYERSNLISLLSQSGFDILYVTGFGVAGFGLVYLKRRIDSLIERICGYSRDTVKEELNATGSVNFIFSLLFWFDEIAISRLFRLPLGTSLIVVAKKR